MGIVNGRLGGEWSKENDKRGYEVRGGWDYEGLWKCGNGNEGGYKEKVEVGWGGVGWI